MQDKVQSSQSVEPQAQQGQAGTGDPSQAGADKIKRLLSLRTKIAGVVEPESPAEPDGGQQEQAELELHPLYRNAMFD